MKQRFHMKDDPAAGLRRRDRLLYLAIFCFLVAVILFFLARPARAEVRGKWVTERCKITVVQPGYIAGVCPATRHFFGTRSSRTYRLGQMVTVAGMLEFDGEIIYPRVSR